MTFGGFIVRRVVRSVVNKIIDETSENKEEAKRKKEAARWVLTGVGVAASIVLGDLFGLGDAIFDHGAGVATDAAIDHVSDHGIDLAADHVSSSIDFDYSSHTDSPDSDDDVKFGSYGGQCHHSGCFCSGFEKILSPTICADCHHSYSEHY